MYIYVGGAMSCTVNITVGFAGGITVYRIVGSALISTVYSEKVSVQNC